jgi:capsular polysaccharide biosynthesis protein
MTRNQNSEIMTEENHDEISLADIVQFVKESYQLLIGFTLIGVMCAIIFLFVTPNQYEASTQIQLAQIVGNSNSIYSSLTNIESSSLLIIRLKNSADYPPEDFEACGGINENHKTISSIVTVAQMKGFDNLVELKIRRTSKEIASKCADAIFLYIKSIEEELKNLIILDARQKIEEYSQEIQALEKGIIRSDGSSKSLFLLDLLVMDELKTLRYERRLLNQFIKVSRMYPTKLFSPIVVSNSPVSPNKKMVLLAGLLGGGVLRIFVGTF